MNVPRGYGSWGMLLEASLYPSLSDISIHPGLCVTNIQYEKFTHSANLSKELSSCLLGNWSGEFEQQLEKLRVAMVTADSTRMDTSLAEELSSWITPWII